MKKIKLEVYSPKAQFFAISYPDSLHKLAWTINTKLEFSFKEIEGVEAESNLFPAQKDDSSFPETSFLLIKNRIEHSILFKELPKVDYLLKCEGIIEDNKLKSFIAALKKMPAMVAVIIISPEKIKRINLLTDL